MSALAERLGYGDDAKLVIISCDDLGACHAANIGVYGAIRDGLATCASIMVPAPWARDAAQRYLYADDIGVHLTLNCEYEGYRFGPITHAPSLLSGEAGFPRHIADLWEHADTEEVLARMSRPDRAGPRLGHRRHPSHAAPHCHHTAARVLRRLPRARRRVPPADTAAIDDHRRSGRLPVPPPRRRGGRGLPRPLQPRLARRQSIPGVRRDPQPADPA